jgi:hypothetical protein
MTEMCFVTIIIPFGSDRLCGSTNEIICVNNKIIIFPCDILLHYLNLKCMIVLSDIFSVI